MHICIYGCAYQWTLNPEKDVGSTRDAAKGMFQDSCLITYYWVLKFRIHGHLANALKH